MLLSQLVGKNVYSGKNLRGTLSGVCISLKSRAVKYLLCTTNEKNAKTEFSVSLSSVDVIDEHVTLKRLKTVLPKNCARVFINRPMYSEEGAYLGYLADVELKEYVVSKLISGDGSAYPASTIAAIDDAVILKKPPVYPIGQRVPATAVFHFLDPKTASQTVTKPLLKTAVQKGELIRLTLSLPPFHKTI